MSKIVGIDLGTTNSAMAVMQSGKPEIIANSEYESSRPYILFLASVFDFLKRKSNNKNYHIIHNNLWKEESMIYTNNNTTFIIKAATMLPEYKQIICDCLKIHLNRVYRSDFIKEIKAT